MKYAVQMGSGAMIYIQIFIKTGSAIQKLIWWGGGGYRDSMITTIYCDLEKYGEFYICL
jgi:hypothetical protein